MDSCHGNPSPSDPMESVCRHFPPPPQIYLAVYLLSLSRTVSRRSDGLLPRQPVSIGSDGVRWPTFFTPSSAILCFIFTKSLANCLPVSLVAHGLLPLDSVWVYWTTLLNGEFGRCCSEGFINITSLVIHSIGDGWTSSVSLNSEQIHQRSNFSNVCKDGNLDT